MGTVWVLFGYWIQILFGCGVGAWCWRVYLLVVFRFVVLSVPCVPFASRM